MPVPHGMFIHFFSASMTSTQSRQKMMIAALQFIFIIWIVPIAFGWNCWPLLTLIHLPVLLTRKPLPSILFYNSRIIAVLRNSKKKIDPFDCFFTTPPHGGDFLSVLAEYGLLFLPYGDYKSRRVTRVKLGGIKGWRLSNLLFPCKPWRHFHANPPHMYPTNVQRRQILWNKVVGYICTR